MSEETGGPAFPVVGQGYGAKFGGQLTNGMTLRDYFAANALVGRMASRNPDSFWFNPEGDAEYAYAVADAMLLVRGNK